MDKSKRPIPGTSDLRERKVCPPFVRHYRIARLPPSASHLFDSTQRIPVKGEHAMAYARFEDIPDWQEAIRLAEGICGMPKEIEEGCHISINN